MKILLALSRELKSFRSNFKLEDFIYSCLSNNLKNNFFKIRPKRLKTAQILFNSIFKV